MPRREPLNPIAFYTVFIALLLVSVSISGWVQQPPTENTSEPADPLLKEFGKDDHLYIRNMTAVIGYIAYEGKMLGVNLTEEERMVRAVQVAAAYADDYDEIYNTPEAPNRYTFASNAFHLTIGRAYNLTDDEIRRYIPASRGKRIYGHHGQPVQDWYYQDVLDPEHKRTV